MAKRRRFTAEFKAELVLEVLSGATSQADARRGRPWENGYAERLIRTLKEEEVKCIRLFRPQFCKVKIRFFVEIP